MFQESASPSFCRNFDDTLGELGQPRMNRILLGLGWSVRAPVRICVPVSLARAHVQNKHNLHKKSLFEVADALTQHAFTGFYIFIPHLFPGEISF